ncbi:efflux RND transporter periplasmic adaptor subunit [Rhodobacteraceae bacterium RKSG542]|uniref:efflux RND transporter periplasmic adaptor subunit n=1 Tax=Pseudovibrio flavus TaxID=2529854 RepID=UPI0012BBFA42|nr:efflux RND transporter periplasmic adaptor subunit [Pseudovibrio flavus]MTI16326.1 efflux RND transporter periplasmic adaptor subunit [Pseudovibrio flavus]
MGKFFSKPMLYMLIGVGIIGGGLYGFSKFKDFEAAKFIAALQDPPQTISTYKVTEEVWQPKVAAVGSLVAVEGAVLAPELAGTVVKINFESGQDVKTGDFLLGIDSREEMATLESLRAQEELAKQTLNRNLKQYKINAVSQQTIDDNRASLKNYNAQVQEQLAVIAKKNIRAPFSGRLGIRLASLGQYLNAGDGFVNLQSLDPLYVDFFIPQRQIGEIDSGDAIDVLVDAFPGKPFKGTIEALDSALQTGTGNVKVRATVPNPDMNLLPGMYVTSEVEVGKPEKYVTVPQTVISYNSYGSTVFLAEDQNKGSGKPALVAKQVVVQTGATRGDQVQVLKGLKAGDLVVSAGQLKLRDGTKLLVNNKVKLPNNPDPKPVEE